MISNRPSKYRLHSRPFKRSIVEQSLAAGASVAVLARENGLNANQIFAWRKLYREGRLDVMEHQSGTLLPVTVASPPDEDAIAPTSRPAPAPHGSVIRLELSAGHLVIEGRPDAATLQLLLTRLLP